MYGREKFIHLTTRGLNFPQVAAAAYAIGRNKMFRNLLLGSLLLSLGIACSKTAVEKKPHKKLDGNSIVIGMNIDNVKEILGEPERAVQDKENRLLGWTFYEKQENLISGNQVGGLTIVFKDDVVVKIMPIYVNRQKFPLTGN